jgi:hypothetical protein
MRNAATFVSPFLPVVSARQYEMLVWAFDANGTVDAEIFLTICEHEGINYAAMESDEQYELLRSLGMTAYLASIQACTR